MPFPPHIFPSVSSTSVSNDDVKDDAASYTYVLPKNILRAFITAADLRTQVAAFIYGASPPDNKQVKEIKAVVWVPQRGNNNSVELPAQLPKDDFLLKDLEPLGWIKTRALELNHLSPTDVTTQAKLMADTQSGAPRQSVSLLPSPVVRCRCLPIS